MQGPSPFIQRFNVTIPCAVDPEESALLTADFSSRINYELYFFSNRDNKKEFSENPLKYCGILTDPVSKKRFRPGTSSPTLVNDGVKFVFYSEDTMNEFKKNPIFYRLPKYDMDKL